MKKKSWGIFLLEKLYTSKSVKKKETKSIKTGNQSLDGIYRLFFD